MAENLILPVPELISAVYLVPLPLSAQAAKDRATAGLSARVASPVAVAARMMLDGGALTVHAVSSSSLPPVPGPLQEYLGVARELVRTVAEASDFVAVRASGPPGWPPMHEWAGRACAAVLATQCGVPLVDTGIPKILAARRGPADAARGAGRQVQAGGLDERVPLGRDRGPRDDDQGPGPVRPARAAGP